MILIIIGCVAIAVVFAGGFWAGWYVRGAYPPKTK